MTEYDNVLSLIDECFQDTFENDRIFRRLRIALQWRWRVVIWMLRIADIQFRKIRGWELRTMPYDALSS